MKPTNKPQKINRITDATLQQKTGKVWQEWFSVLNRVGAKQLTHQQIAKYLSDEQQLDAWWAQMITVGYEQHQGKRERHQKPDGYEISVSKTFDVPLSNLYNAWVTETIRKKWLSEPLTIRKAIPNKSMRITWSDNLTNVTVNFYDKGDTKSQVVVQHSKISDLQSSEEKKLFWKETLNDLSKNLRHIND